VSGFSFHIDADTDTPNFVRIRRIYKHLPTDPLRLQSKPPQLTAFEWNADPDPKTMQIGIRNTAFSRYWQEHLFIWIREARKLLIRNNDKRRKFHK
jgi:hypothetical protein